MRDAVGKREAKSVRRDKGQVHICSFCSTEASSDHSFHRIHHRNHTLNVVSHACFCVLWERGGVFISPQIFQPPVQPSTCCFSNIINTLVIASCDVCLCGPSYDINLLRLKGNNVCILELTKFSEP